MYVCRYVYTSMHFGLMCVYMYIYMCVCVCVCVYVCVHIRRYR